MTTVRIGCLHTADSNIAVFDAAAQMLGPIARYSSMEFGPTCYDATPSELR